MAFGSLGRILSGLFGSSGGSSGYPLFPEIHIGDDLWPQVQASVDGIDRVAGSFRSFREPLKESVSAVIIPSIRQNFEAGGRPRWRSLSDNTAKQRQASGSILNRTGHLKSVATSEAIWRYTENEAQPDGMDQVAYAGYHQGGTTRMPQREFMVYQEQDKTAIEEIFALWLDRQVAQHWRR